MEVWACALLLLSLFWETNAIGYTLQTSKSSCCISSGVVHRNCGGEMTANECRQACDVDALCKGYTMVHSHGPVDCNIYTTSTCPNGYSGPNWPENVGDLTTDATCESTYYSGCYIKNTCRAQFSITIAGLSDDCHKYRKILHFNYRRLH